MVADKARSTTPLGAEMDLAGRQRSLFGVSAFA
jgi:hypothetical protein